MNNLKVCIVLVLVFLIQKIDAQIASTDTIETVVITDSKIPRPQRATSRSVTIIDQSTIQQYQGKDIAQLLEDQVGLIINGANSNPASIKNVYTRGAAPGFTLFLIDGVPVTDASAIGSTIDLRNVDISLINRIEVAKGSHSTLYGSDAIAGVINIITKTSTDDARGVSANISGGSFSTYDLNLGAHAQIGKLQFRVNGQLGKSDGISEAAMPEMATEEFDNDFFEKSTFGSIVNYEISPYWNINASFQRSNFDGGYDTGSFVDGTDTYESELSNRSVRLVHSKYNFGLNLIYNNVKADRTFFTGFGDFIFDARTQNVDAYVSQKWTKLSLVAGLHYQQASIRDMMTTEVNPSWNLTAPYANAIFSFNNLNIEAGARFSNHSNYGSNFNYALTPSLMINDQVKLFASYATAFKAPALYELYGNFGANPDLRPQTSATLEIGGKYYWNSGIISLTYFDRDVDDVIVFLAQYDNAEEQNDNGIELEVNVDLNNEFNIIGQYTYLNAQQENLFKRPSHQVGLNFSYTPSDKWSIQLVNQYVGDRTDAFFNFTTFLTEQVNLDPYLRSDLSVQYQMNSNIDLFGHVNNLWDADYFETYGFSTQGVNYRVGLSVEL